MLPLLDRFQNDLRDGGVEGGGFDQCVHGDDFVDLMRVDLGLGTETDGRDAVTTPVYSLRRPAFILTQSGWEEE
jgi:hypothetical protein